MTRTTLLAIFALSLTFAPSTAFGKETGPQDVQQEAQEGKRGRRKKAQPRNVDKPAETTAPAQDSEVKTAAKRERPRRPKPPKASRRTAEPVATPSPSLAGLSATPSPEPAVSATAAANATPSFVAASTSALKPASDDSIFSLPVVLSLFTLTLIALVVTVFMLMKELRGSGKPGD